MFQRIINYLHTREGKEVIIGMIIGLVGIITIRAIGYFLCLAYGIPVSVWTIFLIG